MVDSEGHHSVPNGLSCLVCFEDITQENYSEYRTAEGGVWHPAKFCFDCIELLRSTQFAKYCSDFRNSKCAREQKVLFARGPPINVHDRNAFPEAGLKEIVELWTFALGKVESRLVGAKVGEERDQLWASLAEFMIADEPDES